MIKKVKGSDLALDKIIVIHICLRLCSEHFLLNSYFKGVCFNTIPHTAVNSHTVGLTSEILHFPWGFICLISHKDFIGKEEGFRRLKLEM